MQNRVIRDVRSSDIDDIFSLSYLLNTVNLPANRSELIQVIESSEKSFSLEEKESTKRAFQFVLTDHTDRVIGTSQILAKHGTLAKPHLYFQVEYDERYSETLKKYFRHRTLRLSQIFDGPTEIGSLVLDKQYRSSKEKLGRNLSYVRFLFMAMRPDFFSRHVLAELLPPLGANCESVLWDAVGRKFTGLDYYEADMISRNNKEFIKTLFPAGEIYVSLLPEPAQEVIGQVGHNSKSAAHLLSKIGFRYSHRVDPFDGGPHFEADQENITLLQKAIHGRARRLVNMGKEHTITLGLCGRFLPHRPSGDRFRAMLSSYYYDEKAGAIYVPLETLNTLDISENGDVCVIDISREE
jgi:arginine N-succinyltransferase